MTSTAGDSTRLRVEGAVAAPRTFGFADLAALPAQVPDVGALVPGRTGGAVRLQALLDAVGVAAGATRLRLEASDGSFAQEAPLDALRAALVAYRLGDASLPAAHGGPIRFLVPDVEACLAAGVDRCTNVKGLGLIRLL